MDTAVLTGNIPPPADATQTLTAIAGSLLAGDLSKQTQESIAAQIEESQKSVVEDNKTNHRTTAQASRPSEVNTIAGLLLGSPEFQRR